jgi:glycosyltransferase involved in cell wall biosynthesis
MRVLMLNNEFPPLGGGTGTVNRALLEQFAHLRDLEIDLVTSALGRRAEQERFAERVRIFKVPVNNQNVHHSSNRELLTYAALALPAALRRHRARPYDMCFAWSAVPAGGVALALQRMARLPYLVRVCGPDIPGFERRYGALYLLIKPAIRSIWRGAAVVVAKCAGEADMIHAVDRSVAVSLIANGVDVAAFRPAMIPNSGPLRLLCVARLIERKGQHHLIEVMRRLIAEGVSVTLDLVGTGDAQKIYQAQVDAAGMAKFVRFVGYVPREEIAAYYTSAHVFVLPSYNEGMSVATLESMAAGLPVVVTRTGGTAELVVDGVNGLTFDWADMETLTMHLRRLALDRALARHMGAASRARAERFSWEAAATRYLQMFDQIVARAEALTNEKEAVL